MEAYYAQQAVSPYFSGHYRQRGSGFGALAAGIGRAALPIARKFVLPAVKRIGKELLLQAAPELIEVASKRKTPKQALKSTVKKTLRKQVGGSMGAYRARRRKSVQKRVKRPYGSGKKARFSKVSRRKNNSPTKVPTSNISRKNQVTRSRSDFFSNVNNDC